MTHIHLRSGRPHPLGATWDGEGVNFAVFSRHATRIELCLFPDITAQKETLAIPLPARSDDIWHVYVAGLKLGQLYGYRVHGPYAPTEGHRFNANKVLLDPYGRAIGRPLSWSDAMFGYQLDTPTAIAPLMNGTMPTWLRYRPLSIPDFAGDRIGTRAYPGKRR